MQEARYYAEVDLVSKDLKEVEVAVYSVESIIESIRAAVLVKPGRTFDGQIQEMRSDGNAKVVIIGSYPMTDLYRLSNGDFITAVANSCGNEYTWKVMIRDL